jgi:hypothetical protein
MLVKVDGGRGRRWRDIGNYYFVFQRCRTAIRLLPRLNYSSGLAETVKVVVPASRALSANQLESNDRRCD